MFKVYIYGAGNEYRKLSAQLKKKQEIDVLAVITTEVQEIDEIDGYKIIRPAEIDINLMDYIIVAVVKKEEIYQKLKCLGVSKEKIIPSNLFYTPLFSLEMYKAVGTVMHGETEWLKDLAFVEQLHDVIDGHKVATRLLQENEKNTHFIIINDHIGDADNCLRMIKSFKMYYNTNGYHSTKSRVSSYEKETIKKVIVVTNEVIAGVAALFEDVSDIIVLKQEELNALEQYTRSLFCKEEVIHSIYPKTKWEMIKGHMFGVLFWNWQLNVPMDTEKGEPVATEKAKKAGAVIINEYKLIPEKTVIICPYAKSTTMLSGNVWKELVYEYKKRGYRVFTNVASEEEELEDTERLQISIDALVGIVDAGCVVTGVQSGIMDVLIRTNMHKCINMIFNAKTLSDEAFASRRGYNGTVSEKDNVTYMLFHDEKDDVISETVKSALFK